MLSIKGQSCGECKHWKNPFTDYFGEIKGWCEAPLPDSIGDPDKDAMLKDAGKYCEVFLKRMR